ncbi:hypothetical protein J3B02_003970 [Coemansia erecta]|nr:hypothetical protein J3B02_003970 [Coemansia erecta]
MANFSSRTDFGAIGMGMGVGAGMMSAMDDVIPHLSLDENSQDVAAAAAAAAARRLTHMSQTPVASGESEHMNMAGGIGGMIPARRTSFFDYGLGGTSHLSLGNVMSEEMHKVSSWLLQNQTRQSDSPANMAGSSFSAAINGLSSNALYVPGADQQHRAISQSQISPANNISIPGQQQQQPGQEISAFAGPPSESDFSIKRKASQEQLDQPRKSRGSVWSPVREMQPMPSVSSISGDGLAAMQHASSTNSQMLLSAVSAFAEPNRNGSQSFNNNKTKSSSVGDEESIEDQTGTSAGDSKRREEKKGSQRIVLTEEERRANHIASEQRRRNQIRQGYAELMSLVTTLRDPALGNHPGTAQSTPSKAVILSHAVQFIRGLEEGNRLLRKRVEGAPRHLMQPMNPHQQQQQQQHLAMQQAQMQSHMQSHSQSQSQLQSRSQSQSQSQPQSQLQAQSMANLNICSPGSPSIQQQR